MANSHPILIYVEDPGSANYVAQFPERFTQNGWPTVLLAGGYAQEYLDKNKCYFEAVESTATAKEILQSRNPRILLVGTSENTDSLGLSLIQEARSMGIETVGVIDAFSNAEYRFRGNTDNALAYAPNWLIVADSWTWDAYAKLGFSEEKIAVCGHPHYEYVLHMADVLSNQNLLEMRKRLFPGIKNGQKIVVFLTEVSTGLNPAQYQYSDDYTLHGSGKHQDRTKICLEEFLEAVKCLDSKPYIVLRLHPKDFIGNYREYQDECDYISAGGSPLELIFAADLIAGMTSMLLLEAALMRRPTLSILPRKEEMKWLPTIQQGMTPCVLNRNDLTRMLASRISNGSLELTDSLSCIVQPDALHCVTGFIEKVLVHG
jgi:hypothetical protein